MTLNEANKIVHIWGKYVEFCQDRLQSLFVGGIPRSLLPYSTETLEEALNIVGKHCHDIGDHKASELIRNSFRCLVLYTEDEKALQGAAIKFNDSELRSVISKRMKKVQEDWIKIQQDIKENL
ncbi:MAG: hypothetical protein ABH865_09015 [Candidatus Omnitrophota bacterium]